MFSKSLSFIFQLLIVIAIVFALTWFDPFNLLSPTQLKLKNTPIQVESIKEIGKLITAEYYGEVIASLDEVIEKENTEQQEAFSQTINKIHAEFKRSINELQIHDIKNWNDKALKTFEASNFDLINESLYEPYLYYLYERIKDRNYKTNDLNKTLNQDQREKLFRRLYGKKYGWYAALNAISTTEITRTFKEKTIKESLKEYKKSKLVLIGRGWVKAGFNFEKFTDKNFKYNPDNKSIYFLGLQPEIISKTINPWFIPEEGVEGFEFVIAEKGGLKNPDYTKKVKQRCLDKLEAQAMSKQILKKAEKNAEKNLKSFFNLLLKDDLKQVIFYTSYLSYTLNEIVTDTIKNNDVFAIDSSLLYYSRNYMTSYAKDSDLEKFVDSINSENIYIFGVPYPMDSRTSLFYEVIEDFKIDSFDYKKIKTINNITLLDTLWNCKQFPDICIDSIKIQVARDSVKFYKNLYTFLQQKAPEKNFNDTTLEMLRDKEGAALKQSLIEIFEPEK